MSRRKLELFGELSTFH